MEISVQIGERLPPKYADLIVLTAKFMHGDADMDTFGELTATREDQAGLETIKRVFDFYSALPAEVYPHATYRRLPVPTVVPGTDWDLHEDEETETNLSDDLMAMFPWDETQLSMGMYENRATLREFHLVYYDKKGQASAVELLQI